MNNTRRYPGQGWPTLYGRLLKVRNLRRTVRNTKRACIDAPTREESERVFRRRKHANRFYLQLAMTDLFNGSYPSMQTSGLPPRSLTDAIVKYIGFEVESTDSPLQTDIPTYMACSFNNHRVSTFFFLATFTISFC